MRVFVKEGLGRPEADPKKVVNFTKMYSKNQEKYYIWKIVIN